MTTKVIFRKWNTGYGKGNIIAFFPEILASDNPYHCLSYEQIGQHGAASYYGLISDTKLAKKEEYQDLYDELVAIGYTDLAVCKRESKAMRDHRHAEIKRLYL